jgi:hypothetical protein
MLLAGFSATGRTVVNKCACRRVAELDFVASAIPADPTAWVARKRKNDLISLQEDRLKAVVSDGRILKTDIAERNRLAGERDRILASVHPGR